MNKEVKFRNDIMVAYMCGCSKSRLEFPEYWEKLCIEHSDEKKTIDFQLRAD